MSIVNIEIPDDGWFQAGCDTRPQDKQLCVVIHKHGHRTPWIYQYRYGDKLCGHDYFLDVSEKWFLDSYENTGWEPGFLFFGDIDRWKPLGLPEDVEERILAEIEEWFEEDE